MKCVTKLHNGMQLHPGKVTFIQGDGEVQPRVDAVYQEQGGAMPMVFRKLKMKVA